MRWEKLPTNSPVAWETDGLTCTERCREQYSVGAKTEYAVRGQAAFFGNLSAPREQREHCGSKSEGRHEGGFPAKVQGGKLRDLGARLTILFS